MIKNFFLLKDKFTILFIFILGFIFNYYFGSIGVFPIDTFSHFDTGYLVLKGYAPFKDYWATTGSILDFFQAFFFLIFGINWFAYIFHSSFFNGILSVSTFILLRKFNLETTYSFFYSLCFAVIGYTISGTPFVDLHSIFFSLLAIYFFIFATLDHKKIYWFCIPIFLGIAFFSKQTPAGYVIILLSVLILFYIFKNKNFKILYYLSISSLFFLFVIFFLFYLYKISFADFFLQSFLFPGEIAKQRFHDLDLDIKNFILQFKFIHLSFLFYTVIVIVNFDVKKPYIFFGLSILYLSSILHQLLTKNQVFIHFLTVFFLAMFHSEIKFYIFKNSLYKKVLIFIVVFFCSFVTLKYHRLYNLHRYFMDMQHVNLKKSKKAEILDSRFLGLKWISSFHDSPELELNELIRVKNILKNEKSSVMLITNYQFFSSLNQKIYYQPNRWNTLDGVSYILKNSKYFLEYKNFIKKQIIFNKISTIYIIDNVFPLVDFFGGNCFDVERTTDTMYKYTIKNCPYFL
jgi:hypothetical protein